MPRPLSLAGLVLAISASAYLSGCATLPEADTRAIATRIEAATGQLPELRNQSAPEAIARLDALLAEPITPEMAARMAVAQNPRVQAAFGALGVARADFLDGALPSNPTLHGARLVPKADEADILKYGLAIDLLSLMTLPARRNAAQGGWEAAKERMIGETLLVAGEGRAAMIDYIAANQTLDLMRQANDAAQTALVAAEAIFAAGNSTPLEVERERLFAAEMAVSLQQTEAKLVPARERVNAALGLNSTQRQNWTPIRRLPAPPPEAMNVEAFEDEIVAASTDLAAAKGMLRAAQAMRRASGINSVLPGLELSGERERDGVWKRGLGLGFGVPLFDLGSGKRLRAQSQATIASANLLSLEIELRAQARSAAATAEATRQVAVARRETILPLSAQVFASTQLNFNAMQLGIFQLLEAKRARLDAGRMSIEATRDYWLAQASLDLLRQGARGGAQAALEMGAAAMPKAQSPH
jgi:outer membrane protein, heavy metal efflux system